jgi:hypothetical protein
MHTIVDPVEAESVAMASTPTPATITTTLYDLITAVQEAADPTDDALVVATVWHVLQSGRVTWSGDVMTRIN